MLTLITLSIFASVALLVSAILYPLLSTRDAIRKRVGSLAQQEKEKPDLMPVRSKWQILLADLGGKLRIRSDDLHTYRSTITAAGFRKESVYVFLGSKLFLALALPAGYLALYALPHAKTASRIPMLVSVALAIAGYLMPTIWLDRRAENRKREIFHSLPDVLDLLTVCVEAGLSLDAAMMKTVENFQDKKNPLIKEINTVTQEVRAGRPRLEALRGVAERTTVEDINSFVSMMIQTEKFGTCLGKTMRNYADSLRIKRKQLAEERAAKTGVKMLFPLTFCVFPALLVVMLAPAFYKIQTLFNK